MEQAKEAANSVTEFFQGNPYSSPVGQLVERATEPNLSGEDWELNMQVCDAVNYSDEAAHDALRAIRKRLQTAMSKQPHSVMLTLTLLEAIVKNGGPKVHARIMNAEYIRQLVVIIGPKYDPPQAVQEKVLAMIQTWADAFRNIPGCQGVCEVYGELRAKGVEFPMQDLDNMAPIITPKRTVPPVAAQPAAQQQPAHTRPGSGPVNPNPEQLAKLRLELDIVNGNLRVLREMISELAPGQEAVDDYNLLIELNATCRQMQRRVVELLAQLANDEVINELLIVNDELNSVFEKYDRYMENRRKHVSSQSTSAPTSSSRPAQDLIDFGADDAQKEMARMNVSGDSHFDMFAQSRQTSMAQQRQGGSTYADNSTAQTSANLGGLAQTKSDTPSDLAEMGQYVQQQSTSSAFDQFLDKRAKQAEKGENDNL